MAHEVKLTMDGLLINWLKDVGDAVSASDIIAEFEADKATVEIEAGQRGSAAGVARRTGRRIGRRHDNRVDRRRGRICRASKQTRPLIAAAPESDTAPTSPINGQTMTDDGRIKASPLARRMAAEKGIDLSRVSGLGTGRAHRQVRC